MESGGTWTEEIMQTRISCNFFIWPLSLQSEILISLKQTVKQRWDLNFALQTKISTHPLTFIDKNSDKIMG